MKGLFVEEKFKMYMKEFPEVTDKPDHAVVEIHMCGVCGTDVHSFSGNNANTVYPVVIGHEAVGTVLSIGENDKGIKAGDRVVVEPYHGCGECFACRQGKYNCCKNLKTYGVHIDGLMAERACVPVSKMYKVPEQMTDEQACMIEPYTIGIHAAHQAGVKVGDHCLIIGAGAIGLICGMIVKTYGAVPIFFDPVDERLDKAKEMGFTHVCNNVKEDAVSYLYGLTNGDMPNVIFECSGAKPVLEHIHEYISVCGRIVLIGWPHVPYSHFDTANITRKELTVTGSRNSCQCFPESIRLISEGKVNTDCFISHIVDMKNAAAAFQDMIDHPGRYMKVLIRIRDK